MNCKNCGKPLKPGASFCGGCGTPVPKPSQYSQAPSQYDRAPSQYDQAPSQYSQTPVQPLHQPAPQPVKKKKSVLPFVVAALVVLSGIVGAISSSLEPPEVPQQTASPFTSPVTFPSPLVIENTQTEAPVETPQVQEPVTVTETVPEVVLPSPEAVVPSEEPNDDMRSRLCSGVWVMYSPQTADAEEYVFYEDGTVELYCRSVMDGTGSSEFKTSGSYWLEGREVVVSTGNWNFTCWFEIGDDRLWYETYNGADMTPIDCYLYNYGASPDLGTLQNDGNAFRQYIQNQ